MFSFLGGWGNHQTLCGGFLRQSTDTLSAWLAFNIDQQTSIPSSPSSQFPTALCSARSGSTDCSALIVCLNSVLSCHEDQRLALRNPCGVELLCSVVFCAGYREAFVWFISEFGAVACHCKCQPTDHRETGGAGGVKTNWFVCIFLCSIHFWWGLCKQGHEIQSWRALAGLSYLHSSWKQRSFSQFQWRRDRSFCHSNQAALWRKCLEVQ